MSAENAENQESLGSEASYGPNFLAAMNDYRAAKATGDAEAIAQAERRLQEVTRSDLAEFERGQGRSSIPRQDLHGRW